MATHNYFAYLILIAMLTILLIILHYQQWEKILTRFLSVFGYKTYTIKKKSQYVAFRDGISHTISIKLTNKYHAGVHNKNLVHVVNPSKIKKFSVYSKLNLDRDYTIAIYPSFKLEELSITDYLELGEGFVVTGDRGDIFSFFRSEDIYKAVSSLTHLENIIDLSIIFSHSKLVILIDMLTEYSFRKYIKIIHRLFKTLSNIDLIKSDKSRCYKCNVAVKENQELCTKCRNEITCILCFQSPSNGDLIAVIMCCNSYSHLDHLESWMVENDTCPYCRSYPLLYQYSREFRTTISNVG